MAVIVKKLYNNGKFLYNMKIAGGQKGIGNLVQWVHIIEDINVISFLHGNELVFTAGIMNTEPGWLLAFAQKLSAARASAFVVNVGPHTRKIPPDVVAYCNEVGLPLFTIPWETKMVDMTRDFCSRIMRDEQTEQNIASTLKNILFGIGDIEAQVAQMERYGYQRDGQYCFVGVRIPQDMTGAEENQGNLLKTIAERTAKSRHEAFVSFAYQGQLMLVLPNYTEQDLQTFLNEFTDAVRAQLPTLELYMGISPNQRGIYKQDSNFEKALAATDMAYRKREPLCYYSQLGIYKILYSVGDRSVLQGVYADTVGRLTQYDQDNGTDLARLLKAYFQSNSSLHDVAEKLFIHRNTVTNQLKKIEAITGYNPLELEDKLVLAIGLYAETII